MGYHVYPTKPAIGATEDGEQYVYQMDEIGMVEVGCYAGGRDTGACYQISVRASPKAGYSYGIEDVLKHGYVTMPRAEAVRMALAILADAQD